MYYNKTGKEIDIRAWEELFSDRSYVKVDITQVGTIVVSTVWVGIGLPPIDDNYAKPLIFETCLFSEDKSKVVCRYATEEQAKEGHIRAVDVILNLKEKEKEMR